MKCPICENELIIYNFSAEKLRQCKLCNYTYRITPDILEITIKEKYFHINYNNFKFNKKIEIKKLNEINKYINFYRKKIKKKNINFFPRLKKMCTYVNKFLYIKNFSKNKNNHDKHGNICKSCAKIYFKKWSLSFNGWLCNAYHLLTCHQKKRFNKKLNFLKNDLLNWLDMNLFNNLWKNYQNSNYDKKNMVCLTRLNYDDDYNLNNLKLQTYSKVCFESLEKKSMSKRKINSRKVCGQYKNNELLHIFESTGEASKKTGCDRSMIAKVCKGQYKQTHGFEWRYI